MTKSHCPTALIRASVVSHILNFDIERSDRVFTVNILKKVADLDFTSAQLVEQVETWEVQKTRSGRYSISSPALMAKKKTKPSKERTSIRGSIGKKKQSPKPRSARKDKSPEKEDKGPRNRQGSDRIRRNIAPPSSKARPPFYRIFKLLGRFRGALDEKEFCATMGDTKELVSTFLEFGVSDLLRDERDIQWIPSLIRPSNAEIQDDAFTRSTALWYNATYFYVLRYTYDNTNTRPTRPHVYKEC